MQPITGALLQLHHVVHTCKLLTGSEISHGLVFKISHTENHNRSSNKRLFNNLKNILYRLMVFKEILFGKKDLGLGLHERDFKRFWLNK